MSLKWLVLDLPAALEKRIADRPEGKVQQEKSDRADPERRIARTEEARTEAGNHIEEWVSVAHRLELGRELVDRVERPAQQGQGRDDEIGHRRGMVELLRPNG